MEAHIRPASPEDGRFIADSWLRSFKNADHVRKVPADLYWREHRRVIGDCVAKSEVLVVCDPLDLWTIYGWICYERQGPGLIIHYVYVKDVFRGMDIGTLMVKHVMDLEPVALLQWTHGSRAADKFAKGLAAQGVFGETPFRYNPYLMYPREPV